MDISSIDSNDNQVTERDPSDWPWSSPVRVHCSISVILLRIHVHELYHVQISVTYCIQEQEKQAPWLICVSIYFASPSERWSSWDPDVKVTVLLAEVIRSWARFQMMLGSRGNTPTFLATWLDSAPQSWSGFLGKIRSPGGYQVVCPGRLYFFKLPVLWVVPHPVGIWPGGELSRLMPTGAWLQTRGPKRALPFVLVLLRLRLHGIIWDDIWGYMENHP